MNATNSLRDWLCREIRGVLNKPSSQPPFLIWCDPDLTWLDILRECSKAGGADGFELWAPESVQKEEHELLLRDRFYNEPRAARVVWLPCAQHAISWFKPFELEAEDVWEKSLLQTLRDYGVEISREHEDDLVSLLPAHAREWLDKPKETWKELTPGNAKGTLVDDHRMLQVLAGGADEFKALRTEGRFDIFARRATEDFSLPDPLNADEEAWRVAAMARLLCTDAAEGTPQEPPREAEKIIPAGLARVHSLKLLKQWQHDIRYIPNFERLVPLAEATVGLTYWARNLTTMPRSRSSRAVEETLFKQTADKLDRLEEVDALAKELEGSGQKFEDRANGFWGKDATKCVGWRFLAELAKAAALLSQNNQTETNWKKLSDAIDWYSSGGWQLDHAGEELFRETADLPPQLLRIRRRLRRGYLRTMDRVGRAFSELLAKAPEKLAALPTAGELALKEIKSDSTPTALIFLDACRLDLGQRLAALLNQGEPVQRASVQVAAAPIPSITALGMAYALPIERTKMRVDLAKDEKSFEVRAEGFDGDLKWAEQRRKWLKETFDVKDWLEIEEVLDGESLKKPGRSRKLIAVHGDEFDSHDGQLKLTGADEHLQRYASAVRKLRDVGYSRIIIVSDHGFFHWEEGENDIDSEMPTGTVLWKHRRAMVGHNLSHPTAVHLDIAQSDLEVVVPRSTNAFRTYGALGFFHGGATLQELIIPVVVATWPVKAKKVAVVLKPLAHITSETPRLQLQAAATGQLFADINLISRSVLVKIKEKATGKIVFKSADPITIEPEGAAVTVPLTMVSPKPELVYGTTLSVEILDADDEELLIREDIELKMDITDW